MSGPTPAFEPVRGAEATVEQASFLDRPTLRKVRLPKSYRIKSLDDRLRDERTRDEAQLLLAARRAGVPVPVVYDIDRAAATIVLEHIDGEVLRRVLEKDDDATAAARLAVLGRHTAALHNAGLTHGDLTTSNVIVPNDALAAGDPGRLVLIDFGLGRFTEEHEPRGVDLHLIEEALEATDDRAAQLFAMFLAAYARHAKGAAATIRRLEGIRLRGRYR